MPLQSGMRIGGYDIVALLGAGGMGEVYRARDTRLGRDVAIKILAPHIAADRDALVRFEREARALAALNHPNIAAIYDVIDAAGQPALVLELVEGDTLADRIAAGRLPLDASLDYARQIAEALDAAHEAGIVHRDLKPGNIKIGEDGRVKVLDFGLAKAVALAAGESPDADPSNSPTITVPSLSHNVILGTAAYMSPEQARGKRIDKRTDIWAFGCVLFEMLTGKRAFRGETSSDVIAAILERAPALDDLPPATPPHVRRVIARCLEKAPKQRARDIADVRAELDAGGRAPVATPRRSAVVAGTIAGLVVGALAGFGAAFWRPAPPTSDQPIEFTFVPPAGHTVTVAPAVSPDGRHIAFGARDNRQVSSIWIRPIDMSAPRRLDGTEGVTNVMAWSPDSRALAFFAAGSWKRVGIDGGPVVTLAVNGSANLGLSWGPNDVLLSAPANRTGLARLPAAGGSLQPLTTLDTDKENSHRWPYWLPDGRHYLFTVRSDSPDRLGIKIGALESGDARFLVNRASQGVYTEPGRLLFMTPDNVLMVQPLDTSTWTLTGTPRPVVGGVRYNGPSFNGSFSASTDGRVLAYIPDARFTASLEWFDRAGRPLGRVGPERVYRGLSASLDGRRIAVELADDRYGTRDLWLVDSTTQALTRLTTNAATDWRAVFSPDGSTVVFASDRAGLSTIFRVATNGTGAESLFYRDPSGGVFPWDWSRDGRHVLAAVDDPNGRPHRLILVDVNDGTATTLLEGPLGAAPMPRLSPDGERIALVSETTGSPEVYVVSTRDRRRVRVSTAGGSTPRWGRSSDELFYVSPGQEIMRVRLSKEADAVPAPPELLFRPCESVKRAYGSNVIESGFEVLADGTRFLANCDPPESDGLAMTVIVNWQNKLR